ncbi:MAG: FAD:protein FMN transferase [Candidatus Dormibacteraeota bacterium]|nr:FAD:protein FMN transferase [Candidatus Dormibacteraeota bacterium]MBV8444275.1 FAD:protein FMN transferase [Candidatus Dormibacteraeota bacterium]
MTHGLGAADDRALGTSVRVVVTDARRLQAAKAATDAVLSAIDMACSRFRDDSELSQVNRGAGSAHVVSPLLGRAVEAALRAASSTDGDVDPTVGGALVAAGYDVDFEAVAPHGAPLSVTVRPVPGWRLIRYDPASRTLQAPPGVVLDLGATAKALAADLAAAAAAAACGEDCGVLVSLGGDLAVAGPAPAEGWTVQISQDSAAGFDDAAERITLHDGALASSSTNVRRWRRGDLELHHIIDPRTGLPAQTPWTLVSVAAKTCVDANTASTAAIVRGERALDWLRSLGLPARLVRTDGSVERIGGWPVQPEIC